MNSFLKNLEITFRRDPTNFRPRINKKESTKDREQKLAGTYYYRERCRGAAAAVHVGMVFVCAGGTTMACEGVAAGLDLPGAPIEAGGPPHTQLGAGMRWSFAVDRAVAGVCFCPLQWRTDVAPSAACTRTCLSAAKGTLFCNVGPTVSACQ